MRRSGLYLTATLGVSLLGCGRSDAPLTDISNFAAPPTFATAEPALSPSTASNNEHPAAITNSAPVPKPSIVPNPTVANNKPQTSGLSPGSASTSATNPSVLKQDQELAIQKALKSIDEMAFVRKDPTVLHFSPDGNSIETRYIFQTGTNTGALWAEVTLEAPIDKRELNVMITLLAWDPNNDLQRAREEVARDHHMPVANLPSVFKEPWFYSSFDKICWGYRQHNIRLEQKNSFSNLEQRDDFRNSVEYIPPLATSPMLGFTPTEAQTQLTEAIAKKVEEALGLKARFPAPQFRAPESPAPRRPDGQRYNGPTTL